MADLPLGRTRAPGAGDIEHWLVADAIARAARLDRLRVRLSGEGVDAYFGVRPEDTRYLTGFALRAGEDQVAGASGQFLVSADETVVLADSRYRVQAQDQCPGSRVEEVYHDLPSRWPALLESLRPVTAGRAGHVARVGILAGVGEPCDLDPAGGCDTGHRARSRRWLAR